MDRLRSFITLVCIMHSLAMPVADDDDCWDPDPTAVEVPNSAPAAILAPYQQPPTPTPSPSQHPHATLPTRRSQTPVILGTIFGIALALVAISLATRYVSRRRRRGPSKPGFAPFWSRSRSAKRLSDESWVSPMLPALGSVPGHSPRRKLVPVTTPVCTPSDTDFGSRIEFATAEPRVIAVPTVQVPSPVYIPPFSPSPSLSSSTSLSPTPSTEPLAPPAHSPARLSRLLSSTFGTSPARPTTAHLIQTARKYAEAYRPLNTASTSLYTPPYSARLDGTQSRTSFYPVRDTISTVSTSDTDTDIPHLRRAVAEGSPFADPENASAPAGTMLGLKLRLSDASEHARYRLCERQRERERRQERELLVSGSV